MNVLHEKYSMMYTRKILEGLVPNLYTPSLEGQTGRLYKLYPLKGIDAVGNIIEICMKIRDLTIGF